MKKGLPVIGLQHGGVYGYQDTVFKHFDADYDRCNHYFSFGYTQEDLARTYPDKQAVASIEPTGSLQHSLIRHKKSDHLKKIDILFAPTRTFNALAWNSNCALLYERQMGIISALEAQKNFITYVKPAPDNKQNSIFYDLASTLKQTRICHLNLYEFMTSYTPRLVILDKIGRAHV